MTKREVVTTVLEGRRPPYVPWSFGFTVEARRKLVEHFDTPDLDPVLQDHFLHLGGGGLFTDIGDDCVRDVFGVVWDRNIDKDIGNVKGCVLPEPTLAGYEFPDPHDPRFFDGMTLRGMANLMIDFYDHPGFVRELLNAIADYNIAQVEEALRYDVDAVHFGDDWGEQRGLQMGPRIWREFIYPVLARMYGVVREAGSFVTIHSCGKVDELFDDLIEIGLDCFNPFQPEVMDVDGLMRKYRGRLAFHGGLSTQKTLPYGTPDDVRRETRHLLELGRDGGYIFAPAHAVPRDVPLQNMLAFMEVVRQQAGYARA